MNILGPQFKNETLISRPSKEQENKSVAHLAAKSEWNQISFSTTESLITKGCLAAYNDKRFF